MSQTKEVYEQVKIRALEIREEIFERNFQEHSYSIGSIDLPDLTDINQIEAHKKLVARAKLPKNNDLRLRLATQIREELVRGKTLTWPILLYISYGLHGEIPETKHTRPNKTDWLYRAIAEVILILDKEFKEAAINTTRGNEALVHKSIIDAVVEAINESKIPEFKSAFEFKVNENGEQAFINLKYDHVYKNMYKKHKRELRDLLSIK